MNQLISTMSRPKVISFFAVAVVFSSLLSSFITSQLMSNTETYRYSDERLKESIVNISYGAGDLEKLRPVSFNLKGKN